MQKFIDTNGIKIAYHEHNNGAETIIMLHGLTANAHSWDGLIKAGLADGYRVLALDLRGRGLSDKPETGYTMHDHAQDVLGLMDALGIPQAHFIGHSYGGLLTIYMAVHYPERIKRMVVVDSGKMPDNVLDIIKPSLERLGKPVASLEAYLDATRAGAYYAHNNFWTDELAAYYTADVEEQPDGTVIPRSKAEHIAEAAQTGLAEDWLGLMAQVQHEAIMLHAPEPFGPPETALPVFSKEGAMQTVNAMPNCTYHAMPGNHITMLFGDNASIVVKTIREFLAG